MNLISVNTNTVVNVATNSIIPYNNIKRRYGCAVQLENGNVILKKSGYYRVYGTIVVSAPTAGNVSFQLSKNNVLDTSIIDVDTITTADTEIKTLAINGIVRVYCGEEISLINVANTGINVAVQNAILNVELI